MAYDQKERMNAEQKEGQQGQATIEMDAVATSTWMDAVMEPDAAISSGNLEYDPKTGRQSYKGEQPVANSTQTTTTTTTTTQATTGNQATSDVGQPLYATDLPVDQVKGDDVNSEFADELGLTSRSVDNQATDAADLTQTQNPSQGGFDFDAIAKTGAIARNYDTEASHELGSTSGASAQATPYYNGADQPQSEATGSSNRSMSASGAFQQNDSTEASSELGSTSQASQGYSQTTSSTQSSSAQNSQQQNTQQQQSNSGQDTADDQTGGLAYMAQQVSEFFGMDDNNPSGSQSGSSVQSTNASTSPTASTSTTSTSTTTKTTKQQYNTEASTELGLPFTGASGSNNLIETNSNQATQDYETEAAAEIAAPVRVREARVSEPYQSRSPVDGPSVDGTAGGGLGMVGLGLSLLALFLLPYLLAPVGIVLGFMASRRGAKTMGTWAIIVGVVALIGAIFVYPLFIAR